MWMMKHMNIIKYMCMLYVYESVCLHTIALGGFVVRCFLVEFGNLPQQHICHINQNRMQ